MRTSHDLDTTGLSAKHLAILARGVSGGDGSTEPPSLDELLNSVETADELDDEALAQLIDDLRSSAVELLTNDKSDAARATGKKALEKITGLEEIQTTRAEEAAQAEAEANDLLAQLQNDASDDGDGEAEGDESGDNADGEADNANDNDGDANDGAAEGDAGDGEAEGEDNTDANDDANDDAGDGETMPIAASNATPPAPNRATRRAAVTRPRKPDMGVRKRTASLDVSNLVLRASSNVPGVGAGELLDTPEKRGNAFAEAIKASQNHRGPVDPVRVATIGDEYAVREMFGEDRTLDDHERDNERKIRALTSAEAIRASGGQCAPTTAVYTQPIIGTQDRPVRDALLNMGAERGGVRLIPPPQISDVTGAIGTWEMATDVTPGLSTKPTLTMTCPSPVETFVGAITNAIKIGNFRNLYWSEQVDAWVEKAAIYAARVAERRLLTNMGTLSTNVSGIQNMGATRDILADLDRALAGFISRQRIQVGQRFRLIAPFWLLNMIRADLTRQAPGDSGSGTERLAMADAEIANFFAVRNVNITWALDGESGQEFGAQAAGLLNGWPSTAVLYLFLEGEFIYLDGGQVNLGVIRDSTLVGTNDFIMFSEFMENVAFHGTEAQRISLAVCPNGVTQAVPTSIAAVCAAES